MMAMLAHCRCKGRVSIAACNNVPHAGRIDINPYAESPSARDTMVSVVQDARFNCLVSALDREESRDVDINDDPRHGKGKPQATA